MSAWRGLGDGSDTPLSRSSQVSHSSGKVQRGTNRGPSHSDVPNLLGQCRGTSPENVRERVLRPRGYSWPVSKIGDARSCISQPRNVEKLFTYYRYQSCLCPKIQPSTLRQELTQSLRRVSATTSIQSRSSWIAKKAERTFTAHTRRRQCPTACAGNRD